MTPRVNVAAPVFRLQTNQTKLTRIERITLVALATLSLALRAVAYFRYRFDSDEPQHLHVAWGWTAGLVQYRDYFDNHAPLFHMLSAPLLAALGERPDILLYMRATMLPLLAVMIGGTYVIGRRFYSPRVALWSAVVLSLYPSFLLKTLEYRTDNLWNALWVVALLVLTGGAATAPRMFAVGALLGIATCVSLKTSLLVVALALAAVATRFALRESFRAGEMLARAGAFVFGLLLAPAAMAMWFVHLHALPNLVYCVFEFNKLVAHTHAHVLLLRATYPFMLAFVVWYGWRIGDDRPVDPAARTRFFLGMLLVVFSVTLIGVWVLISPRDLLPIMPLGAIAFCSWLIGRVKSPRVLTALFAALIAMDVVVIGYGSEWLANPPAMQIEMVRQTLQLTRPGDMVMDLKGETIYRQRPYYFVFEKITRDAIHAGLLPDRMAEAVVSHSCHVAQADSSSFPPRSREFLNENFLLVGLLRASGQWLRADGTFTIAIPGDYVMLDRKGECRGMLGGAPYSGPQYLAAGAHRFLAHRAGRVACLWAPAYQRGFSPFHLRHPRFE
jgi:hypothetical protein